MKVNCNFLPKEYHAFHLDMKVMVISVVLWVGSLGVFFFAIRSGLKGKDEAKGLVRTVQSKKTTVESVIRAQTYPQDRIIGLKEKFEFIGRAMGESPKPFLRFFQSLEDAIPVTGAGGRGVYISRLSQRAGGNTYSLEGASKTWTDALRFEDNLTKSEYDGQPNFPYVKLTKSFRTDDGYYRFDMELKFRTGS